MRRGENRFQRSGRFRLPVSRLLAAALVAGLAGPGNGTVEVCSSHVAAENFPDLIAAVEAARGGTVVVSRAEPLRGNLIVPADVALVIANGGSIEKRGEATLTIEGSFSAAERRVFSGFRPGEVAFGSATEASPRWWGGGEGGGGRDDAPAINAAIASLPAGRVYLSGEPYLIRSTVTVRPGITLAGNGKTAIRAGGPLRMMVVLAGNAVADGVVVDGNNRFGNGVIGSEGGEFGILALNSSGNIIRNCTVSGFRTAGIAVMAWAADRGDEAHDNRVEGCTVTGFDFGKAGAGVGGICIIVRSMYAGDDAEPLGEMTRYRYDYAGRVSGNTVSGCTTSGGLHGVIVHNATDTVIRGNTLRGHSGSAVELCPKAIGTTVAENRIADCGGASINVAYGSRKTTVTGNAVSGTHASYNYAVGVFYGAEDTVVSGNRLDSRFDSYKGNEDRAPGAGILVAQYCRNTVVSGNSIRGYRYGVWARSVMYPGVAGPSSPEYRLTGFRDLLVRDNVIQGSYVLAQRDAHRLPLPQESLYGIWLDKNSPHDDLELGAMPYTGIRVEGNTVEGVEHPYVVSEVAATALHPARFEDILFRANTARRCTSAAGLPNYPQEVNLRRDRYRGIDNSWDFIPASAGPPPAQALFGFGERVRVADPAGRPGEVYEYIFSQPGLFKPLAIP